MGCSIAHHLARLGCRDVLVLERENLLGTGAKNLSILDDSRLIFSGGNRLMILERDGTSAETKIAADETAAMRRRMRYSSRGFPRNDYGKLKTLKRLQTNRAQALAHVL